MTRRSATGPVVVAVSLAGLTATGCADTGADEPFLIGYVGQFTGDVGVYDRAGLAGAQYEAARRNAQGGVGGRPIEIRAEDTGGDPERSDDAAAALIAAGADLLFVPPLPDIARGAVAVAAEAGLPAMSIGGTIPTLLEGGEGTTFLSAFGDNVQAAAAAEYALESGLVTAYTITTSELVDYGDAVPAYFAEAFTHLGGEIVGTVDIALDPDGYQAAARAVASLPAVPDLVYTAVYPPYLTPLLVELRAAGYDGPVFTADGGETARLFDAGDALGEVVLTAHAYSSSSSFSGMMFSPRSPAEKIALFADGFERFHGAPPESLSFAALGADAIDILHAAAQDAGSADPSDLIRAIGRLSRVDVTTGRVTYRGQAGIPLKVVYVLRAEDGEFDLIRPVEPRWVPEPATADES